jgi:hypothetical protein
LFIDEHRSAILFCPELYRIEVPFLLMPLVLIWLGHPFKR